MMIDIPIVTGIQTQEALWAPQTLFLRCGFQIFRYRGHRNKDQDHLIWHRLQSRWKNSHLVLNCIMFQIYKCKQFLLRSIVTDVAGLIIFKNKNVSFVLVFFSSYFNQHHLWTDPVHCVNWSDHCLSDEVCSLSSWPSALQVPGDQIKTCFI